MGHVEHVYGIEPVRAALTAGRRRILQLVIAARGWSRAPAVNGPTQAESIRSGLAGKTNDYGAIEGLARSKGIPVQYSTRTQIDALCPQRVHQGVALLARSLPEPPSVESFLHWVRRNSTGLPTSGETPSRQVALMLHKVVDTRNVGAVMRTAAFLGAAHVILSGSCAPLSPDTSKASAGAIEHLSDSRRILAASSPLACIRAMRAAGWTVLAAVGNAEERGTPIADAPTEKHKVMVVLGNEGSGLSKTIIRECNGHVTVPHASSAPTGLDSLNVSVAAALVLRDLLGTPSKMDLTSANRT